MSNSTKPANRLLAALPDETYQRLLPYIEPVELACRQTLYNAGDRYDYAYFPENAMISIVAVLENGATAEIGVVGNEGMIGVSIVLNTDYINSTTVVQIGGNGYRIAIKPLQNELRRYGALQMLLMRYVQARIIQLGQIAACNSHHRIEQRFARWLLQVRDSIQADKFNLTHEFIAQMLGVRRSGVSVIANKFQEADIIKYSRGTIRIISAQKLEAAACECHATITKEFNRLLDFNDSNNG